MNITALIMKGLAPRARAFEQATKDPMKAQERVLRKYLARNRRTEYGMKYDFSSIRSIKDFRARLPLSDYEVIRPYVERIKKGEQNILTSDKVVFFGITSGTTGEPKLIPVTRYSQARKADLMGLWAYYAHKDHPCVLDGKILAIISPEIKGRTESGIPYGPEDGHAYNNLPEVIKRSYVLPYELFYIEDYDARYYSMLRIALGHDITTIATLNPSTLVFLCQRLPDLKDRLIADIEHGTLDPSLNIDPAIRSNIIRKLKPDPRRAKKLRAIIEEKGKLLPKDFWPNLDLIECWKGGTVRDYLAKLPEFFGDVPTRDFGCLSTEARSSIPMSDEGACGVLAVQTNFYEFIPKEDIDKADKRVLLCDQLETGKEYLLIVTTPGGLYRYNIDDVIRVCGSFNGTPVIEFIQKGRNAVSITGEKVYESHVVAAMERVLARYNMAVRSFCASVTPVTTGNVPRYIFLVEFDHDIPREDKRKLITSIDVELRIENSEYDDLRKQKLLDHPSIIVVKEGEFDRYRRKRVKNGAHDTQFKMPKLVLSPDFIKNFSTKEEIII